MVSRMASTGLPSTGTPAGRLSQPVRAAVLGGQGGAGLGADERVAGPGPAHGRGLHQEGAGLALGQLPVEADRRLRVRQHLEPDGNDAAAGLASSRNSSRPGLMIPRSCMAMLLRLFFFDAGGWRQLYAGESGCWVPRRLPSGEVRQDGGQARGCRSATARPLPSKQVRVPVWQAAPTWSTRTSRASPSQSMRHRLDPLDVAGRVALAPVLLAGAGIERDPAAGHGAVQRLVVHPAEHQHLVGVELLDDGGHQAGAVALERGGEISGKRAASGVAAGAAAAGAGRGDPGDWGGGGLLRHQTKSSASRSVTRIRCVNNGTFAAAVLLPNSPRSRASFTSDAFRRSVPRSPGRNPAGGRP